MTDTAGSAGAADANAAHFDRRYFDRWYRDPRHRVFSAHERARRVASAISATELLLGRRIRSVLDIGCGEAHWRSPIRRLRPRTRYVGIDPSPYVVQRFGRARNIRLGSIENLDRLDLDGPFDLVLAVGFLNLLSAPSLASALHQMRPLIGGVALLELFTSADELTGDAKRYTHYRGARYRAILRRFRLVSVGFHLYAAAEAAENLGELEYGG